jgi:uncharacterized protein YyaL (SSP411 family)
VDGREGLNYVWTPEQVRAALSGDDAAFALKLYGLEAGANFRDPHHPAEAPVNVLRLDGRLDALAAQRGERADALNERVDRVNTALLAARAGRKQPLRDDKVIAGWNGLAIGALADAAGLGSADLLREATRAAEFVVGRMMDSENGLLRATRAGAGATAGFLEDYACLAQGLVRMHAADESVRIAGEPALVWAERVVEMARARFGEAGGGLLRHAPGACGPLRADAFDARWGAAERGVGDGERAGGSGADDRQG